MSSQADLNILVGDIMKVISVDHAQQAIHVFLKNGQPAIITSEMPLDL